MWPKCLSGQPPAMAQKHNTSQMSGNKTRNCSKRALVLIKSSKHKGGYIYIYIFKVDQPHKHFAAQKTMMDVCTAMRGAFVIARHASAPSDRFYSSASSKKHPFQIQASAGGHSIRILLSCRHQNTNIMQAKMP